MLIKNVKVFTEDKEFKNGAIALEGDKIKAVYTETNMPDADLEEIIDGNGAYAIPGLIDLHFHGCKGDDFCDGTKEAIGRIAEYEASIGVTAIAPATMTLPVEELEHILEVAAEYKKENTDKRRADLLGINMEGPFISPAKKGAQDERNIIPCNVEICERFLKASDGLVKFMGIAPEDLPRIFEKGYTGYNGRRDKKASGLGLYLCARICRNLGHGISAESEPDKGTVIKLNLNTAERMFE